MPAPRPPTAAPAPASIPVAGVQLSEVLPAPRAVDWIGTAPPTSWKSGSSSTTPLAGMWTSAAGRWTWAAEGAPTGFRGARCYALAPTWSSIASRPTWRSMMRAGRCGCWTRPAGWSTRPAMARCCPIAVSAADALGAWHIDWRPSPGGPNLPPPPPHDRVPVTPLDCDSVP